jgi:beta-N-acetylhexosaminidase
VWPIAGVVVLIAAVVGAVIATDQPPTPQTAAGGASPSAQEDNEVAGDHDRAGHGAPATAPATPRPAEAARVEAALADMSLQQKVGQLLVAAVRGDHPTDVSDAAARQNSARFNAPTPAAVVERHRLGGVIYFTYADVDAPPDPGRSTIRTPVQTAELSRGLQSAAVDSTGVGLVIATDQEHGFITRTPDAWTRMPGPMALAATRDRGLAEASARAAARELRAVGINVTLAPVADVNTEPDNPVIGVRSPGGSPSLVADVVAGQVRGLAEGGVGATAKHFPGHGSVDVDSHAALPTVEGSAATLRDRDLAPFEAAIDAGVGAIMPGHLSVPAFDDQNPATVSRPLIDGLLRGELGFDGVVVTDALDMAAIAERGSSADVALRALRAGVDMLLMPPDLPAVRDSLLAAVDDGRLSRDRLDASVRRILTWKAELGLLDDPAALPAASPGEVVGAPEHGELARRVAQRAITAVDGACDTLPVGQSQQVVVVGPADGGADALAAALSRRGVAATAVATGLVPSASEIRQARQAAAGADVAVQVTTSAWRHQAQRRLNAAVADAAPALVTVSTAEPYDAVDTDADVQLAAYDRGDAAMAATAGVLRGKPAPGRLPVPVGDHPLGAGGALAACGKP